MDVAKSLDQQAPTILESHLRLGVTSILLVDHDSLAEAKGFRDSFLDDHTQRHSD